MSSPARQVKLRQGSQVRDPGLSAAAAMVAEPAALTEFEGALMSELQRRQPCSAYQLKTVFQGSPSLSWSGSAGAVYPAVRRLTDQGLIVAEPVAADRRGALRLSPTPAGEAAATDWVCDAQRAADGGFDPFRTRIALIDALPAERRTAFLAALKAALQARVAWLDVFAEGEDAVGRARAGIDRAQQVYRLAWIADWRARSGA